MDKKVLIKRLFYGFLFLMLATNLDKGTGVKSDEITSPKPQPSVRVYENKVKAEAAATPLRVGIQAGHWKNDELPDEFIRLRLYGGGATVGSITEWEVNLDVARRVAKLLEKEGVVVDILPATIPPGYEANIFITLHADGNDDSSVTGFKVAASDFDRSGLAQQLSDSIESTYQDATQMRRDTNITENMTEYYAFNYIKYNHTISSDAIPVMVELGFLTNAQDRRLMVSNPDKPALGIAQGVLSFLRESKLL